VNATGAARKSARRGLSLVSSNAGEGSAAVGVVVVVSENAGLGVRMHEILTPAGYAVEICADPLRVLEYVAYGRDACVLLDLGGIAASTVLGALRRGARTLPVIVIDANGDPVAEVTPLSAGVPDPLCASSPCDHILAAHVKAAMEERVRSRRLRKKVGAIEERLRRLTPRERQVLAEIATGKPNKVVGRELGISDRTVEAHRGRVMRKLEDSLAGLVRCGRCRHLHRAPRQA